MKQKIYLSLVLFLFAGNLFAQSGWVSSNASPIGGEYNDMFFVNNLTGWIVGNAGLIMKTEKGGTEWTIQTKNRNFNLTSLYFVDALTGIAIGTKGKILRTTNGGNNWAEISGNTSQNLTGIIFFNPTNGIICGDTANILKTSNAGLNWVVFSQGSYNFRSINKLSSTTAIILSDYQRVITTDMGNSWTNSNSSPGTTRQNFFINSFTGWASGLGTIFKTTNAGESWDELSGGLGYSIYPRSVNFISEQTGFAVGLFRSPVYQTFLLKTTNSGVNWSSISLSSQFINMHSVKFIDANTGICVGELGAIYKTTNGGDNWQQYFNISSSHSFYNVQFVNSLTGYSHNSAGSFMKCIDGGSNWVLTPPFGGARTYSLYFYDINTGWVGADTGRIFKTTNGGNSWTFQTLGDSVTFNLLQFIDSQTGWALSNYGIYRTTNAGFTWGNPISSSTRKFQFINSLTGFATAAIGTYKTTNGGSSWQVIGDIFTPVGNLALFFLNEQTGWICGTGGISRTTNGGLNWATFNFFNSNAPLFLPSEIKFINNIVGFCIDSKGNVVKTTDGGVTWFYEQTLSTNKLYSINFVNENTGWIGGENGILLKTTTAGSTFITQTTSEFPDKFLLKQNYPNPFNPITVIRYQLSVTRFTTLKVFDLLGKEVATLVNEKQNAGSYAVDFNSTEFSLPSGIYFYTLNAGEFKETRKMVLVK